MSAVPCAAEAELVVLNSCTVTAFADEDVRKAVRRVHRENPGARILVTGCYAQRAPEEIAVLPGVAWVVGNSHKIQIPDIVSEPQEVPYHGEIRVGDIFAQSDFLSAPVEDASGDRTRPNLKIQDGCNNRCSFCIIPFVRGRSRSAPVAQIVEQVRNLAGRYREVVLSGINLGRWGREPGSTMRLADLLRELLAETAIEQRPATIKMARIEHSFPRPRRSGALLELDRIRLPRAGSFRILLGNILASLLEKCSSA